MLLKDSLNAKTLQHTRGQLDKLHSLYDSLREENTRLISKVASIETERDNLLSWVTALQSATPAFSEKSSETEETIPIGAEKK